MDGAAQQRLVKRVGQKTSYTATVCRSGVACLGNAHVISCVTGESGRAAFSAHSPFNAIYARVEFP